MSKKNIALIVSGGEGKRFDKNKPKQFFKINEKTILEITVKKFVDSKLFDKITIVCSKAYLNDTKKILKKENVLITLGGETRQDSVFNGLKFCKKYNPNKILIHDVVRPFFSVRLLNDVLKKIDKKICVIPALKIFDSVREVKRNNYNDLNRNNLKLIQTPQGFNYDEILNAHKKFEKLNITDDSLLAYKNGCKIKIVDGEYFNYKITEKNDLLENKLIINRNMNDTTRTGSGFDVHKFTKGDFLILCGIKIPFNKSLEGHSDADVGFHSLVDAILGSIGKGDIGEHFPPSQKKWKDKNSLFFLEYAVKLLDKEKFKINNLDLTIICEKPKMTNYKEKMKRKISEVLNIELNKINIKATTTEKLGFLGREEGIACQANVTVSMKNDFIF
mgnify:CR=1 FL=1